LKNHLESQVTMLTDMSSRFYDAVRKMTELNMHLCQLLIEDATAAGRQLITAAGPIELSTMAVHCLMPSAERLRDYQQRLVNVLAGAQVELTRCAESHLPEATRSAAAVAEEVVRNSAEANERIAARHRSAMEKMSSQTHVPDGHQAAQTH
ncbi:MAG: phasin family protein, partial [Pseudomonadota bacterium]